MWQRAKNLYHLGIAILANIYYQFPSKKLKIIGVTGTDGKTTTTSLIYHILNNSGLNVSMITSVGAVINGKNYDVGFHVTTPSSFAVQRFIAKAARGPVEGAEVANENFLARSSQVNILKEFKMRAGKNFVSSSRPIPRATPRFLVLETTSHALDQYRVFGIRYEVGVLTNVTHEHLDYHKTYENYVKTKAKLLVRSKIAITNRDDKSFDLISNLKSQNSKPQLKTKKFITYGLTSKADVNPKNFPFNTQMIGEFNVYNSLAAIAACKALGISDENIRKGLKSFKPPIGREEIIYDKDFKVMIDFAHTPNAFDKILSSVRKDTKGRIIHVFGSAGLRDRTKRPLMGEFSSKYADVIILTAEDPRTESVEKIMDDICSGIQNSKFKIQNYNSKFKIKDTKNIIFRIPNRKEAIETAIKMARKGDLVIITGKSHEKSMNYGQGEVPWDEFKAVKDALRLRHVPDGTWLRSG